jgi:SAM-dependent methyltransferase
VNSLPDPSALQSLDIPVPPKDIRYRIASSQIDEKSFLDSGRQCATDIITVLNSSGIDARDFRNILDFGCGCSRALRFLIPFLPEARFDGCDIDSVAIEWSTKNVPAAKYSLVPHLPPTAYPSEQFDFIYGLSVFTHLDLPRQILWLDELHRMLRPGGRLLLTVHGASAYDMVKGTITKRQQEEFDTIGYLFLENISDKILPDWYQTAIYKERFGRLIFQSGFSILRYDAPALPGAQDSLLLQKK